MEVNHRVACHRFFGSAGSRPAVWRFLLRQFQCNASTLVQPRLSIQHGSDRGDPGLAAASPADRQTQVSQITAADTKFRSELATALLDQTGSGHLGGVQHAVFSGTGVCSFCRHHGRL